MEALGLSHLEKGFGLWDVKIWILIVLGRNDFQNKQNTRLTKNSTREALFLVQLDDWFA